MCKSFFIITLFILNAITGYSFTKRNLIENSKPATFIIEKDSSRYLSPADLNVKTFFKLFTERYSANNNSVTLAGDFPIDWVKEEDIPYLMSLIKSTRVCCSYVNIYSSAVAFEKAQVGGFAIIFMNSYIAKKPINLGLINSPKTNPAAVIYIEEWYSNRKKE